MSIVLLATAGTLFPLGASENYVIDTEENIETHIRQAVVKVYAAYNEPDYYNPWSMKGPRTRSGSGAVIDGGLIITNAHIVSDVTFLQVRRYGDNKRYEAYVHAVQHQSDLAIVKVVDASFFDGIEPLKFGALPDAHQEVSVYGYPLGGDALSITKGVVSRIEHRPYVHSSSYLLAGQIDAAINPGSSGGPVIADGRIVGITMQSIPQAQNIGYMVPVPIVERFLEHAAAGDLQGFPGLGLVKQGMENADLRRYYLMEPDQTGMLITDVVPGSPSDGNIFPGDVLLTIGSYQVFNDGTVEFRPRERTSLSYVVQKRRIGETVTVSILREGEILSLDILLASPADDHLLVPLEQYDVLPTYYIYGGFVFSPLSKNLLRIWGDNWFNIAPVDVVSLYLNGIPQFPGEQVIVISRVLSADINDGYQDVFFWIVDQVNGIPVRSMEQLIELIEENTGSHTILENTRGRKIILDHGKAASAHQRILSLYRISHDRSADLR